MLSPLLGKFFSFVGVNKTETNKENNSIIYKGSVNQTPVPTLDINQIIDNQINKLLSTQTPLPTYTPYPTKSPKIENSFSVVGLYSWYWPPLGGINCDRDSDGKEECQYMANGDRWEMWTNKGFACPNNLPFGTRIEIIELNIFGWCVDRGSAIVIDKYGRYWIDHLTKDPLAKWSTPVTLNIYPK